MKDQMDQANSLGGDPVQHALQGGLLAGFIADLDKALPVVYYLHR